MTQIDEATVQVLADMVEELYKAAPVRSATGEETTDADRLITAVSRLLSNFGNYSQAASAITWLLVTVHNPSIAEYILEDLDKELGERLTELAIAIGRVCDDLSICRR